jgi:nicotinate dehydrogenase subunit B
MAAVQLVEPVEHLTLADGAIIGKSGRQVRYEEFVESKHFNVPQNTAAKRRSVAQWSVLGKSVPSLDRTALMTTQFEFLHCVRVPGMLHGRVVRPPEMGATVAHVDEQSVQNIPGLMNVVRKDFIGVVAETQYQAVLAARQLVVRWNPGPELPPQRNFFDHLQKQPSHDVPERRL